MKNVIVFVLGNARYGVELRWVREVTQLGHVTPVPGGPAAVAGVVNVRGAIVPVLSLQDLAEARQPKAGDSAILIEVEGTRAIFPIDNVHAVCTLPLHEDGRSLAAPGSREAIPLLSPPQLISEGTAAGGTSSEEQS